MFNSKLVLEALVLGVIQGLTEFLPVSSSGHLVIAQHFLPAIAKYPVTLDVTLHLGTLLALLVYFKKDIWQMLFEPLSWLPLIVATMATGLLVLPFKSLVEETFTSPHLACLMLFITGSFLWGATKVNYNRENQVSLKKALGIGIAQALAVLPGISRSGTTISAGIFLGLNSKTAAKFSFLIAIPIIFGAGLLELKDVQNISANLILPYIVGFTASFITGLWALRWLLKVLSETQKVLKYFAYYCWLASIVFIIAVSLF